MYLNYTILVPGPLFLCLSCWDDLQVLRGSVSVGGPKGDVLASTACCCDSLEVLGPPQWKLMADGTGYLFFLNSARTSLLTCFLLHFGILWANALPLHMAAVPPFTPISHRELRPHNFIMPRQSTFHPSLCSEPCCLHHPRYRDPCAKFWLSCLLSPNF